MRWLGAVVLVLLISGCAIWSAGEDPKGKELKQAAAPVIKGLQDYRRQNGHYPDRLEQLVPVFIQQLPSHPAFFLDASNERLHFIYSPTWPEGGQVDCSVFLEKTDWLCSGYL
jgi:hypothetical protein